MNPPEHPHPSDPPPSPPPRTIFAKTALALCIVAFFAGCFFASKLQSAPSPQPVLQPALARSAVNPFADWIDLNTINEEFRRTTNLMFFYKLGPNATIDYSSIQRHFTGNAYRSYENIIFDLFGEPDQLDATGWLYACGNSHYLHIEDNQQQKYYTATLRTQTPPGSVGKKQFETRRQIFGNMVNQGSNPVGMILPEKILLLVDTKQGDRVFFTIMYYVR